MEPAALARARGGGGGGGGGETGVSVLALCASCTSPGAGTPPAPHTSHDSPPFSVTTCCMRCVDTCLLNEPKAQHISDMTHTLLHATCTRCERRSAGSGTPRLRVLVCAGVQGGPPPAHSLPYQESGGQWRMYRRVSALRRACYATRRRISVGRARAPPRGTAPWSPPQSRTRPPPQRWSLPATRRASGLRRR